MDARDVVVIAVWRLFEDGRTERIADQVLTEEEFAMIQPTVGRVVWFYKYWLGQGHKGPLAAIVADVHSDECVTLMVIDTKGQPAGHASVRLIQDWPDGQPLPNQDVCCWMPYQKGQAKMTEKLAEKLGKLE